MSSCKYCSKDFSGKKEKLDHELEEHKDEMSSHEKSEKKSELNKLQQKTQTSKHRRNKQIQYGAIGILLVGLVAGGGFYAYQNSGGLSGTQNTNANAAIGQPVHWHADYQITVCGEDQTLRGGPAEAHTHGEATFHLEGVRHEREQATLDWVVDQLGGQMEENSIMGKESCNGEPANLTVKANGNTLEEPLNYVVRDGDFIRITYES